MEGINYRYKLSYIDDKKFTHTFLLWDFREYYQTLSNARAKGYTVLNF